ncbi:pentatricopeptide repeat-containing protein at5g06540 [Phtheirospermum japonicum]|uniref:Pentatricopeptide repeat-containing protein at5g06540 n=1 Tax=Phtheirospermum japonicum TaxID=374723 RepID=A0A830CI59_9LAMI|nr:pentatricopeptide repeat-containing protein at5g06540 [Phtheirospermum japonicum]
MRSLIHRRTITTLSSRRTPCPPSPPPAQASFSQLADKCKSMDQIKQIQAQMIITARIHDIYAASRLLNFSALSDSGDLNYALKLFHSIPSPNLFMWNTVIRAHAASSNPINALLLYAEMRMDGISPGTHTFPFVLKACSSIKSAKCCQQVHGHVLKFGLDSDLHVANGLIRGYSVSGKLSDARKVFDELPERNLSIWTTMISGYAQNDYSNEAITLFNGMISNGFEPNGVVLSSVLSACAQSACLDLGEQIHMYIEEKGIGLDVILGTAVVNMYAKNGAFDKAKQCFDGLREKNTATWNSMISGLAVHGHADEAIHFFRMLEEEKIQLNDITLLGVLSASCHAGLLDYGSEVFYSMKRVYGIEPNLKHYGCMVDLLGRKGRILEAESLIEGMIWEPDVVIWGALLSACKECGNIEVAERVVKKIHDLDPENHGVYVVLSNMYAEAGRWGDVLNRREVMKEGSLKKTAGWSLVGGDST